VVSGTTISDGGVESLSNGGTAVGATIDSGGMQVIGYFGGSAATAISTTISNDGT
jgi:autotransporter passenger strand-loop-strand repeat protein